MDKIEEIKKLKALLDQGAISEEEFNSLKKEILSPTINTNESQEILHPTSQKDKKIANKQTKTSYLKLEITKEDAIKMLTKMDVGIEQQSLVYYSEMDDYRKTELLLIAGLNPNKFWYNPEEKINIYPLHITAGRGTPKMVKLLLSYGAEIDLEDDFGNTALFYAIEYSTKAKVKVLLENGANINHKNKSKINPLYTARKKDPAMVALLIKAGAEEMPLDVIQTLPEEFEDGNETTVNLLKSALFLSLGAGVFFWIRYDSFVALIIVAIIGISASLAIPKLIPKLLMRNLLLGLVSVAMLILIIFPIGNGQSNSNTNTNTNPSQQSTGIDRSNMNYCSKHSQWYYKDGSCPKCVDESIKESTEKARKKFNHL